MTRLEHATVSQLPDAVVLRIFLFCGRRDVKNLMEMSIACSLRWGRALALRNWYIAANKGVQRDELPQDQPSYNYQWVSLFDFPSEILEMEGSVKEVQLSDKRPTAEAHILPDIFNASLGGQFHLVGWRHLFADKADKIPQNLKNLAKFQSASWMILMCHGGDFAAAIFERQEGKKIHEPKYHKTSSRYIVRKKQGKRQSSKDSSHRPNSAGAHLRRYNEKKFGEEVREVLEEWRDIIENEVKIVFVHCPGHSNRKLVFYEGSPLGTEPPSKKSGSSSEDDYDDDVNYNSNFYTSYLSAGNPTTDDKSRGFELHTIPFPTKTPNFTQVKECFAKLTTFGLVTMFEGAPRQGQVLDSEYCQEEFYKKLNA